MLIQSKGLFWILILEILAFQKFLSSLKPSRNWGPIDPIQRHGWVVWREQCTLSGERDFTLKRRGTRDYTHSVRHAVSEPLGARYYPQYSKPSQNEKTAIHDTLNGTFTINSVPNYSSTQATDVNVRGVPYTVQLPEHQHVDHVCWRKDMTTRSRPSWPLCYMEPLELRTRLWMSNVTWTTENLVTVVTKFKWIL